MAPLDFRSIDGCFEALAAAIGRDAVLARQLQASRHEFFPGGADPTRARERPGEQALATRRHMEWFLLEKEKPGPQEARIAALIERCARPSGVAAGEVARSLAASHASVFEVTRVERGRGVWLWDLAGLFQCAAVEAQGSLVLAEGDVIAGRVFPMGGSLFHVSRASALWRNPRLLVALRTDLDRARARRPATQKGSLRLRQSEIEAMFHAHSFADGVPGLLDERGVRDAVGEAREMLLAGGVGLPGVDAILARLAVEEPAAGGLLPGADDALREILDSLAFETSLDLEAARRTLLGAWEQLRASQAPPTRARAGSQSLDVAAAVAEFDRKRREGAPLEQVFQDLERDLGLADPAIEPEDEDTPAPDFPGVVAAMIEEFLWDEQRDHGDPTAQRFESLRSLGRFAADIGVFENLSGRELTAYACRWLPESGELADAGAAQDLIAALARFCLWAQENHEVPLLEQFETVLMPLHESLPRLVEANRLCARRPSATGEERFEYSGPGNGRGAALRDSSGELTELAVDHRLTGFLRPGDVLRGRRLPDGSLEVSVCYPPEVRRLQEA